VTTSAEWLQTARARVDAGIRDIAERLPAAESSPIAAAARYAINSGGKRIRPCLCLATYEAVTGEPHPPDLVQLACSVELIHAYSLVHDDLPCMDNDYLRRGQPTTHSRAGNEVAMLTGGAIVPLAFRVLLEAAQRLGLDNEVTQTAALELARSAGGAGMVGGQVLDLESEGRAITLEDLESLHRAKTGALIGAAARLGAIVAEGSPEVLNALWTYARCLGLAFQIIDDVLDETRPSEELGKTAGKDRAVAKATFPAFMGVDAARARAHEEIAEALAALDAAGIRTPPLEGIARFAIERDR
jgi:geranylgeranyl diphosphate synthase type II